MKSKLQPIIVGIVVLGGVAMWRMASHSPAMMATSHAAQVAAPAQVMHVPGAVTTASGLQYKDERVGRGAVARPGMRVTVHYTGWLANGQKFDSSLDRNEPFTFKLGAGEVITGWDQGVAGMRVGGRRTLLVPPALGYGAQGAGGVIPGNAQLKFTVDLLKVE